MATTAETNNERATVEEFRANLYALIRDAQKAGIPRQGLHDISAWLGHCHKAAGRALDELDKEAG